MLIRKTCEITGKPLLNPFGPKNSPILILWDALTQQEYEEGWYKSETSMILRSAFAQESIDVLNWRQVTIWPHEKTKDKADQLLHLEEAIKECEGRKAVLLLGSDCTKTFLGYTATAISGLARTSDLLSTVPLVMGALNPSAALGNSHGEFHLSIKKFANKIRELNFYE